MDIAIHSGKFTAAALCRLNYCRMQLNVLVVSDIATANGKEIDAEMYSGQADKAGSWNNFHQFNQPRPNDKAWKQWRKFISIITNGCTS